MQDGPSRMPSQNLQSGLLKNQTNFPSNHFFCAIKNETVTKVEFDTTIQEIRTELENFVPGYLIKISTDTDWFSPGTSKMTGSSGYVYSKITLPESMKTSGYTNNSGASPINLRTTGGDWSEYSQSSSVYISSSNAKTALIGKLLIMKWIQRWVVESNYIGSLTLVLDIAVVYRITQTDGSIVYTEGTASGLTFTVKFETNSAELTGDISDIEVATIPSYSAQDAKVYITKISSVTES